MIQILSRYFVYNLLIWGLALQAFGQPPPIQWQRTIGGSGDDRLLALQQTHEGGYIAAGISNSGISGEKTDVNKGDYDFWIVKLGSSGNIEWQKTYGSIHTDQPFSITQTSDNGFLVAGYSVGDISGDKTEPNRGTAGTYNLGYDLWILKLTAAGGIQWQRTYGTNGNDVAYAALQRNNASYIVAGLSEWHAGLPAPRPPDRTTANPTWNDYWILKLDVTTGAIQHQEAHGGNRHDNLFYIIPTTDGGYIGGGLSGAAAGTGNKTTPLYGGYDNWIIKMDSNFTAQWQTEMGGAQDDWGIGGNDIYSNSGEGGMEQTSDGGYIIGNSSLSGVSGNKTEASWGGWDWWVVKLNTTGGISWQKELGGSGDDRMATIMQTPDGGYLTAGTSNSPVSGNKTELPRGDNDFWLVKLDAARNIEWQQAFGGSDDDQLTIVRKTADGGYILGGFSKSGISGEKSENARGNYDFWIIKLGKCDTTIERQDSFCIGEEYRLPGGALVATPGIYTDTLGSAANCDTIIITTLSYIRDTVHLLTGKILGADTTFCEGQSWLLNAAYSGAADYLWSTGATGSALTVTHTDDYWVRVTSATGCQARDTVTVTFMPGPAVDLGPDTGICAGAAPLLLQSPQPAGADYLWSNGLSDPQIQVTRSDTYWLEVTLGNCKERDTIHVKVIREPEVNIGPDTIICEQFPLRTGTQIPGVSYRWSTGETTSYIQVNRTGDYILEVNLEGCLLYDTIAITAMPEPDVDLGGDRDICPEETILLDATQSGDHVYVWNTGAITPSYAATSAGLYHVTVTTEHHCIGRDSIVLTYHPRPVVLFGPDTTVCEETPLLLAPAFRTNADSLVWSDGSVGSLLSVKYGGEYIVTGINRCGTGSDTIMVKQVFCDIWLPNAFTPNNDGINDMFRVLGNTGRLEGFDLSIYNRWGQCIFHTQDKYQGWDGRNSGGDAVLGTYVYQLQYNMDGKPYLQKGNFHLLR